MPAVDDCVHRSVITCFEAELAVRPVGGEGALDCGTALTWDELPLSPPALTALTT
jgi:hypothetical protein